MLKFIHIVCTNFSSQFFSTEGGTIFDVPICPGWTQRSASSRCGIEYLNFVEDIDQVLNTFQSSNLMVTHNLCDDLG